MMSCFIYHLESATMKILIDVTVYVDTVFGVVGECVQCLYEKTKDSRIKPLIEQCLIDVMSDYENQNIRLYGMKVLSITKLDN